MSYWVYQHLGNLAPAEIRAEGMLARFVAMGDATAALREWAKESEEFTPVPGGYRFSYFRDLGKGQSYGLSARGLARSRATKGRFRRITS